MISQTSHFFYGYFAINETLVPFKTCYKINFLFISSVDFSTLLVLFIALDRLISVKWPAYYTSVKPIPYVAKIVILLLLYCALVKFMSFTPLIDDKVMCLILTGTYGSGTLIWFICKSVVCVGILLTYVLFSRVINDAQQRGKANKYGSINQSVKIYILSFLFSWFLSAILGLFFYFYTTKREVYAVLLALDGGRSKKCSVAKTAHGLMKVYLN
ncbi:hypothetical protein L596_026619 [Steinernema carpocapsae]|nr:hypothetical protein L596_026619 [Steinernema carpocapsae]